MNTWVMLPLCFLAWAFTLARLRLIVKQGARKAGPVALNILCTLLFLTITLTFLVVEIGAFVDARTLPNFSTLIYTSAFLSSLYFGLAATIAGMEIPAGQRIIRWLGLLLGIEIIALLVTYIVFFSNVKTIYLGPQGLPQIMLIAVASFWGIVMFIAPIAIQLIYFPSEKFALMRLRTTLIILCSLTAMAFLLTRIMILAYYPLEMPPVFTFLSYASFIGATLLSFLVFTSDRVYARFVVLTRSIEEWRAFQDLKLLVDRLIVLCPVIGLPVENPNFWKFLFNPEYYLYRAIIIILDSKAMLIDFLADLARPGMPPLWEEPLHEEAIRINQALQTANPSNDFSDIVETYRRVSRDLFASQKNANRSVLQ